MRSLYISALLLLFLGSTFSACQLTEVGSVQQMAIEDPPVIETEAFRQVDRGMTPTQVRRLLGAPAQTIEQNGEVVWMVYSTSPTVRTMIYFQEGKVKVKPDLVQRSHRADV